MAKSKIKIPKSVLELRMSPKKFAKRHGIKLKGKHLSKRDRKYSMKRLQREYSEAAINGLNKAVKILAENDGDSKKILKVKEGVENIIMNANVMKRVAKLYRKNPSSYPHMIFLPYMIMNTLAYYASDQATDEEKAEAEHLDGPALIKFCERILKKQIKRYRSLGLSSNTAFRLACTIPTTKLFKSRKWYRQLINTMYDIALEEEVDVDLVLRAVSKIDKKSGISRKEFLTGFFSEFILTKNSNAVKTFNDNQKDLHEALIDRALVYLNGMKGRKLRDVLKQYIRRRKTAESYKNDSKRVIKFVDHANSNSSYTTIKAVVQELIADNSSNELYLS